VNQADYHFEIIDDMCDEPSEDELQYLVPFLPELVLEMNRILSINED